MRHTTFSLQGGVVNILKHEKVRFVLVGTINTIIDFGILSILSIWFGIALLVANVISTSCALSVSYLLNKKAVFGDRAAHSSQQVVLFIVVTLSGLWILQTGVIVLVGWVLSGLLGQVQPVVLLFAGKVVATVASLTWNYIWYSRVVFRKEQK